jgi:hypothetical protein
MKSLLFGAVISTLLLTGCATYNADQNTTKYKGIVVKNYEKKVSNTAQGYSLMHVYELDGTSKFFYIDPVNAEKVNIQNGDSISMKILNYNSIIQVQRKNGSITDYVFDEKGENLLRMVKIK